MDNGFNNALASSGASTAYGMISSTYNAGLSDILAKRANDRSMQNLRESNEMSRANFRDSAQLQKEGAIRAGMSPLGSYQSTNITPSAPTASAGGSFNAGSSDLLGFMQLQNENKVANAQEKLLNEQTEAQRIDNARNKGYDTSLKGLVDKFPELNLTNVDLLNKGVFDAVTDFENLRRTTVGNSRANEEDKLYYDALSAIRNDPAKKAEFEESVLENVRTIKLANQKLLGDIDLQKMSKREIYSRIKNLDADTIYKNMITNLSWEQSRYYAQLVENLEYESDWKLLDIGLDENNDDSARALAVLAIKHGNIDGVLPKLLDIPKQLINGAVELFKFKKFKEAMERLRNLDKDKFDLEKLKFETRSKGDKTSTTEKFDAHGNFTGGSTTHTTTR